MRGSQKAAWWSGATYWEPHRLTVISKKFKQHKYLSTDRSKTKGEDTLEDCPVYSSEAQSFKINVKLKDRGK